VFSLIKTKHDLGKNFSPFIYIMAETQTSSNSTSFMDYFTKPAAPATPEQKESSSWFSSFFSSSSNTPTEEPTSEVGATKPWYQLTGGKRHKKKGGWKMKSKKNISKTSKSMGGKTKKSKK
jgi:hypothetical protein